jgi:hypothetical protein
MAVFEELAQRKDSYGLSVHADDSKRIQKAKKIFDQTGADDIASTRETKGEREYE